MRRLLVLSCIVGCLISLGAGESLASWLDVPLDEVVRTSPVVVTGKITEIKPAGEPTNENEFQYDTAFITVAKVLKNDLKDKKIKAGDKLPLSMPAASNKMIVSTDIRFEKGREGVWILELQKETFRATYPKDYQALSEEKKISEIIAAQITEADDAEAPEAD